MDGILTTDDRLDILYRAIVDLRSQLFDTNRKILTAEQTRRAVAQGYEDECERLGQLRDDCVVILNVLVEAGAVSRAKLNEAIEAFRAT